MASMAAPPDDPQYVQIHLKPHAVFQREHNDLHCEMPISFHDSRARRGDRNHHALTAWPDQDPRRNAERQGLPPCASGHQGVRSASHGDLMCHVAVETPVNLTERQKELLRELEELSNRDGGKHNPRARNPGWIAFATSSAPPIAHHQHRGSPVAPGRRSAMRQP